MKKLTTLSLILLGAALFLSACSPSPAPAGSMATEAPTPPLIAEGRLWPANAMDHSFSIHGQVAEVLVKDGDQVLAGQVLARLIASQDARLSLLRAQQEELAATQALNALTASAELNLAQAELARIAAQTEYDKAQYRYDADDSEERKARLDEAAARLKMAEDALADLVEGAGVNPESLAIAEARLETARAAVVSARAVIEAAELKAIIGGTVAGLGIQTGQKVTAGQSVLTVADFSRWEIRTDNLTELDVVRLEMGATVKVVLDSLPGQTFSGTVTGIELRYEEKRGDITYTVTVLLDRADPLMRWGMTAAVQLDSPAG